MLLPPVLKVGPEYKGFPLTPAPCMMLLPIPWSVIMRAIWVVVHGVIVVGGGISRVRRMKDQDNEE
jgi:hypothetical protein